MPAASPWGSLWEAPTEGGEGPAPCTARVGSPVISSMVQPPLGSYISLGQGGLPPSVNLSLLCLLMLQHLPRSAVHILSMGIGPVCIHTYATVSEELKRYVCVYMWVPHFPVCEKYIYIPIHMLVSICL